MFCTQCGKQMGRVKFCAACGCLAEAEEMEGNARAPQDQSRAISQSASPQSSKISRARLPLSLFILFVILGLIVVAIEGFRGLFPYVATLAVIYAIVIRPQTRAISNFQKYINQKKDISYAYLGFGAALAISAPRREIHLMTPRIIKAYSFSDIRSWKISHVTADKVIGYGFMPGMIAIGENARAKERAARASGLFICVRDIEMPEWQIAMPPEEQKKWFEILTQLINEGESRPA